MTIARIAGRLFHLTFEQSIHAREKADEASLGPSCLRLEGLDFAKRHSNWADGPVPSN